MTFSISQVMVLLPLLGWWLLHGRLAPYVRVQRLGLVAYGVGGVVVYLLCWRLEQALWGVTGLQLKVEQGGIVTSLAAMLLFAAPLEEGGKLLLLWPAYRRGRLRGPADGVLRAVTLATGFAVTETMLLGQENLSGVLLLRLVLSQCAHIFFAGVWGFVLGSRDKLHWLRFVWASATLFHGLYAHIVLWRGAGTLAAVLPGLAAMAGLAWVGLRRIDSGVTGSVVASGMVEGPSLQALIQTLRGREQPVMLHWILMGAFVTAGMVLTAFACAVYLGHQVGIDFSTANESDMRSSGPLVLLGGAMMTAFPFSGYLVARASGARSVLEPAMGAALALAAAVGLMSMAAPLAVVFALAVAPVAFGLACAGAWFGLIK